MDQLPVPSDRRIAVHVTGDALRQVRAGHPWVWDRSIERSASGGRPGDLAVVFDRQRRFAAIGLYDPDSPIQVRVLHQGPPRTIDRDFFLDRLVESIERRRPLIDDPHTSGYRLVHGENDLLPGLIVDRYDTTLVLRLDTVAWVPHLATLVPMLAQLVDAERVVLRASRQVTAQLPSPLTDGAALVGALATAPIRFFENAFEFGADVVHGHKTGHFLDQRDNRRLAATRCHDADVIDLFCHTGGFTVSALAAGARSVLSVDQSAPAVDATIDHVARNRTTHGFAGSHHTRIGDAFDIVDALLDERARFDVAIVDPPSFAPNAASVPAARRAYRRLTRMAIELLGDGGTLVQSSCSSRIDEIEFHDLIADEVDRAGLRATNVIRTAHPLDHPIGFPHGAYLKTQLADLVTPRSPRR